MPAAAHQPFELCNDQLSGYSSQGHFQLPELGPTGSNCLANARDFQAPIADYEDDQSVWTVRVKIGGQLFDARQDHSPFDVVAWHGNFYPYKYDLGRFNTIGSISYDRPDLVSSRS
ncbi:homogentisate 1,2-dioxygenase-domain-containing protein [Plectosphaerella cucumerina]|uniref:homogentisate 1,2-dioxygenase n=1 Tax=Plectosphaerella cucumerina TaxID=40658 RepID=A0A8K0X0G7_9PEZI|nr:homogentisate 1,2-dioxygenase-domain-containing protein [Plectosphaerella cucumerina]